jgi:uncharacterized coiled-coil DUF342 family protein
MPPKARPKGADTRSPEDRWFDAMKSNLTKVDELKERNKEIQGKLEHLSERRMCHNVEIGNFKTRIREGIEDEKELRDVLKMMRVSHRWSELYSKAYEKLERDARLNVDTMELLLKQLYETPFPGEEPLVYTAEDGIE